MNDPAAGHQLDPALRDQVDRRELLVDPDRVLGADSTVTALPSPIRLVWPAAAANTMAGADTA